jgi:hypothetical protein
MDERASAMGMLIMLLGVLLLVIALAFFLLTIT